MKNKSSNWPKKAKIVIKQSRAKMKEVMERRSLKNVEQCHYK